jgi:hypothetical protein
VLRPANAERRQRIVMVLSAPITLACQTDSNISGVLM